MIAKVKHGYGAIALKGGYVYYVDCSETKGGLFRCRTNGNSKKKIVGFSVNDYSYDLYRLHISFHFRKHAPHHKHTFCHRIYFLTPAIYNKISNDELYFCILNRLHNFA